jgi:hypothetical protein
MNGINHSFATNRVAITIIHIGDFQSQTVECEIADAIENEFTKVNNAGQNEAIAR